MKMGNNWFITFNTDIKYISIAQPSRSIQYNIDHTLNLEFSFFS